MKNTMLAMAILLINGCALKSEIRSGQYTVVKTADMPQVRINPSNLNYIKVDAEKHQVELFKADNKLLCNAEVLPKNRWMKDCYTNTSHQDLETWRLKEPTLKKPLYLIASCDKDFLLLSNSLEEDALYSSQAFSTREIVAEKIIWINTTATIVESAKLPDGSYAYTIVYNANQSDAVNMENQPINGDLDQHIFGVKKRAKQGQKLKVKYNKHEPMQFQLLETIVWEE